MLHKWRRGGPVKLILNRGLILGTWDVTNLITIVSDELNDEL